MGKMADLAYDPTKEENAAEESPQPSSTYRSSASLHSEDMKKMGMDSMGAGQHVEGMIHGVVSNSHEGGMSLHITHGGLKKMGKSAASKMYGEPDADDKAGA